jgi:phosphoribosyl 1,2-cyclic phosphate phosphodiesterase
MSLAVTILGCGSSTGVPRVGAGWGACDPAQPKNRRRRCSILVEQMGPSGKTSVLVDTSPDLRQQLLDADVTRLEAVLYTHDHADHTHGIDDLRPLVLHMRRRIAAYADAATAAVLQTRFGYCFATPPGSSYPPIVDEHRIVVPEPVVVDGPGGAVEARPFRMIHGPTEAIGFRFGALAYAPDVSRMPSESADALALIEEVRPHTAVLTNLHSDIDYDKLRSELPDGVVPAFDGMKLEA